MYLQWQTGDIPVTANCNIVHMKLLVNSKVRTYNLSFLNEISFIQKKIQKKKLKTVIPTQKGNLMLINYTED